MMMSNVLKNLISDFFNIEFKNFKIILMEALDEGKQIGVVFHNDGVFIEIILYDNNTIEIIRLDEGMLYGKNVLMYSSLYGKIRIKREDNYRYTLTFKTYNYFDDMDKQKKTTNTIKLKEPLFDFEKILVLNKIGGVDVCKELIEVHLDEDFIVL